VKTSSLLSFLSVSAAITGVTLLGFSNPARSQQTTFSCGESGGVPATVAHSPKHGDIPVIKWVSNYFEESGYDTQTRCNQVSARFQEYSNKGTLKFLTTGRLNRESVICVTESEGQRCTENGLLFTIKKTSSPGNTLKKLLDYREGATKTPLSETTEKVFINFDTFLQEKSKQISNSPQASPESSPEPVSNPIPKPIPSSKADPVF
jgi:hypothetical protein